MEGNGNPHFHQTEEQYLNNIEGRLKAARTEGKISESDEICIRRFLEDKENVAKASRLYKLTNTLILNREFFPEYISSSTDDYKEGVRRIRDAKKDDGTSRFKQNTINDRAKIMKSFFLFLAEQDRKSQELRKNNKSHWLNQYPGQIDIDTASIKRYSLPKPQRITKTEVDIYTEDEIIKMIEACHTSRERAIVTLLYETGCRASEIGGLKWGQVDAKCQFLETFGKTKKRRFLPIEISREALLEWKKDYPMDYNNPEAFVFVNYRRCIRRGNIYCPLSYQALSKIIKTIGEMAEIKRPLKLHNFRHTRITHMLENGFGVETISMMMWGSVHSNMIDVYAHLSDRDIRKQYAEHYGLSQKSMEWEDTNECRLRPIECPHCHNICGPTSEFCSRCGTPLTEKAKNRESNLRDELRESLQDEEICSAALKRMKKNGNKCDVE